MAGTRPVLRPAATAQRAEVVALLRQAGLPVADLEAGCHVDFIVALDDDRVVGAVGTEPFGTEVLLRSLVVDPSWRGQGIGDALVVTAENTARTRGARELWLLTTDASEYFVRRGYVARIRADAPASLKESAQFKLLCPSSAMCLRKALV